MKRMLFNATQQEELRVAIVDGQKLIDIDIEIAGREQHKGNIYKGVIARIEPSLEACFINYGEDRHGFLPFKEIAHEIAPGDGDPNRRRRIQDSLREGQELIVQVEKEERGNKGAALTNAISLAGRYLVLMPNSPSGGGISRRIEGEERQELRETMAQLQLPDGMSIIVRTAGIGRNLEELQWDLNYLTQLWRAITEAASHASGPLLIYLESSLVIRAIRDYFYPDISEILIDTEEIYEQARTFMSIVMPDNLHKIKRYHDDVPLFTRFQIEHQIEMAYSRIVPLPSGGVVVIDHTEALVAVDVNSARATKGLDIGETALRTNLEAAEEVARQLRLRDLGGLIVIDFIDMEAARSQREVEQYFKEALKHDRARVQIGKISRFGLMELSRQRLQPALSEGSYVTCLRCNGTGHIRDIESSALQVLRLIQEEAMKDSTGAIHCQAPVDVAAFLLNEKRQEINRVEARFKVNVVLIPNKYLETPHYRLERLRHDDPRLDSPRTSYKMAEEAAREIEAETIGAIKKVDPKSTRQEAIVKRMTPEQPAPANSKTPKADTSTSEPHEGGSLIGWVKRLFGRRPTQIEPKADPSKRASACLRSMLIDKASAADAESRAAQSQRDPQPADTDEVATHGTEERSRRRRGRRGGRREVNKNTTLAERSSTASSSVPSEADAEQEASEAGPRFRTPETRTKAASVGEAAQSTGAAAPVAVGTKTPKAEGSTGRSGRGQGVRGRGRAAEKEKGPQKAGQTGQEAQLATSDASMTEAITRSKATLESLEPMLNKAGLVWVNTDADKTHTADQHAQASTQDTSSKPPRRRRKSVPQPLSSSASMTQIETSQAPQATDNI